MDPRRLSVLACAKLGAIAVMAGGNLPIAAIERLSDHRDPASRRTRGQNGIFRRSALHSIPLIAVDIAALFTESEHS